MKNEHDSEKNPNNPAEDNVKNNGDGSKKKGSRRLLPGIITVVILGVVLLASIAYIYGTSDLAYHKIKPADTAAGGVLATARVPESYDFDDYEKRMELREEYKVDEDFTKALNSFAYKTTSTLSKDAKEDKNFNYSPLSLYYALSVAASGAGGETQEQMMSLLGVDSTEALATGCGNLYRQSAFDNEIGKYAISNSIWLDDTFSPKEDFMRQAATSFYASTFKADLESPEAAKKQADWIKDNTNGTLTPDIEPDKDALMSIINTVYFRDEWNTCFDESATKEDTFHAPESDVSCDFMNRVDSVGTYYSGNGFIRSDMSLKNNGSVVFILPDEGTDIAALMENEDKLRDCFEGGEEKSAEISWSIPKFSFGGSYDLVNPLTALGADSMFGQDADFSGISDDTLFISKIIQESYISINENGIEASAYTSIQMAGSAMPQDSISIALVRPFIYGITSPSGELVFIGCVMNPAK